MLNKVQLIGNLGKDPEIKKLESGDSVANFSMATSETYKNKAGEKVTDTEWHNIVLWRKSAEIAEKWLKKGSKIYLEGKITTRKWKDKDGNDRYSTEIVGHTFKMLDSKPTSNSATQPESTSEGNGEVDDLPF